MIEILFYAFMGIYVSWVSFNTYIFFAHRDMAGNSIHVYRDGRVAVSITQMGKLTSEEQMAILSHEAGHVEHGHMTENYLIAILAPFLLPFRKSRRMEQEHEADDYAACHGPGAEYLSSALLKLSDHPDDIARSERLGMLGLMIKEWEDING